MGSSSNSDEACLDQTHFEENPRMKKKRFAESLNLAAGLILLFAAPASVRAESVPQDAMRAPTPASPATQPKGDSLPDFFVGLNYTDDQKAEIAQIRKNMDTRRGAVAKDDRLTQDQKDAMTLGYTHLENGEIFKVLTPEQRRQVRQRLQAHRATG